MDEFNLEELKEYQDYVDSVLARHDRLIKYSLGATALALVGVGLVATTVAKLLNVLQTAQQQAMSVVNQPEPQSYDWSAGQEHRYQGIVKDRTVIDETVVTGDEVSEPFEGPATEAPQWVKENLEDNPVIVVPESVNLSATEDALPDPDLLPAKPVPRNKNMRPRA